MKKLELVKLEKVLALKQLPKQIQLTRVPDYSDRLSLLQASDLACKMAKARVDTVKILDILSSFDINKYMQYYIDNADYRKQIIHNKTANNIIIIIEYLFREGKTKIVDYALFKKFYHSYRISNFRDDIEYIESLDFVIKDFTLVSVAENIEPDKEYKGGKVFVSLGNDIFKAISYNIYKKLYNIEKLAFSYSILLHDEYDNNDVLLHKYIKNISGIQNIINELRHYNRIYDIFTLDVSTLTCDIYYVNNDTVTVFNKDGTIDKYEDIQKFIDVYFPGGI